MSIKLFSASAGSGKTYTLTIEYIKLALSGTDSKGYFRRILAVTFTIKAAEEMRSRIIEFLELMAAFPFDTSTSVADQKKSLEIIEKVQKELSEEGYEVSADQLAKRAKIAVQQILQDYGLFSVMTIDSFVQRLSASFIEELNLPNQFEVILDSNQLVHDLLDRLLEKVNQLGDPELTSLILDYAKTEVHEGRSWNLLRKNLHHFLKICLDESYLKVQDSIASYSIQDFLSLENKILTSLKSELAELSQMAQGILQVVDSSGIEDSDFYRGATGPISAFRKFVSKPVMEVKKFSYHLEAIEKNKWYGGKVGPEVKLTIEGISDELSIRTQAFLEVYQGCITKHIILNWLVKDIKKIALLTSITDELKEYQLENSAVSISEFSKRIYEVISSDPVPFIYEKLGDRYFHILIDEFQDTSVLQWQNFMPLLENTVSTGKINLLVGDAKQSIYKFRGGEVGLITSLGTKDPQWLGEKLGDNPLDVQRFEYMLQSTQHKNLAYNFRSAKEIVDFNNEFFSFVANQNRFTDLSDLLQPIYGSQEAQIPKLNAEECSGFVDIQIFEKPLEPSVSRDEEMEWMLEQVIQRINQGRQDGYLLKDMAILTRKNMHAKYLAIQLKEKGISVISSDSLYVHYSPVVSFLNALLRLILKPKDEFLYFEAIYQYRLLSTDLIKIEKDELNLVNTYLDTVISLFLGKGIRLDREKLNTNHAVGLIYYLIDQFNLLNDKDGTEYIFKYLDILHEFVLQKSNNLEDFVNYYELNKANFSIACPDHMNAVTITSIHKSKGLEYPVVILPFTSWTHQADHEKIWFDISSLGYEELQMNQESLPFHYGRINSKDIVGFDSLEIQSKMEKDAVFLDSLNMLYVATTRAKQRLHILMAQPSEQAQTRSKTVFEQSVGQMFIEFLQSRGISQQLNEASDSFSENQSYYCLQGTLARSINKKEISKVKSDVFLELKANLHDSPTFRIKSSKSDLFTMAEQKRRRGDAIHDFLAGFSGMSNLENQIKGLEEDFQLVVNEIFSNSAIKELFVDEELLFVETDILCPDGTTFRPDRVILKNGHPVVIDFKTGIEKESHRKQIVNYKNILTQMGYKNVQGVLLYLADQRLEYV
jgi:ATP-dependent exoDNAse (exonuclease V) beta subunit